MRFLTVIILSLFFVIGFGQVQRVDYQMQYNCETNAYDVSLVILEGEATTVIQRAQFNAQISLVVPTGEAVEITDYVMPLENNQNYNSLTPMEWRISNPVVSPEAQPESDFYSIFPSFAPTSYYNNLNAGDRIKLFSFVAGESGAYDVRVRFFDNGIDPSSQDPGMQGGDFSNGFSLGGGGGVQIYNDHSEESCLTGIDEELDRLIRVYPNPFEDQLIIELSENVKRIEVSGMNGIVIYQEELTSSNPVLIDTNTFPSGVFFVRIQFPNEILTKKLIKY